MKKAFYRMSKVGPQTAYKIGLGPLIGKVVLLLTTTGRKTGLARVTPLQYEVIDGVYHIGAVFGLEADWVRNIQANPQVEVRVKNRCFKGTAEVVSEPEAVADFIQYRLEKHPRLIGVIMTLDGFKAAPTREEMLEYSKNLALVRITPEV
ncbi:MAG: nitroreductase/quinone reductase family protein [Anaerolineales bacterium]|jgi:deazaflavin-dependent oxidoreductase (nitroreductase family)